MDAGQIRVSSQARGLGCVIRVSGELTLVTEREFAALVAKALAASWGPVLFDVSEVDFVDCRGARALVKAVRAVPPPREAGLDGCSLTMRGILATIGFDLPRRPEMASAALARLEPRARPGTPSREEALAAMSRVAESTARQSALYTSEVMSRLAATYSELALNSRYRMRHKSADRGRLLELSGRALDLSRRFMRNAADGVD
jgi:anti-anti-sigma regulatory factor